MSERRKLNAPEIFETAEARSGLGRFADDALRTRFETLIGEFNDHGSILPEDYPDAVEQLVQTVVKRLQVARDWHEHPEILDEQIVQPFFVLGNARAGTTYTQSLLTLEGRTPTYRDCQHPSPPPGMDAAADARAMADADAYAQYMVDKSPRMMSAHPYLDQLGASEAECEYPYSLDFDLAYPLYYLKVPSLPQCGLPRHPVQSLTFYKNMLKQFQWKQPTARWIGKGVLHQYIPGPLMEVFPDMVGFWIHRPPEQYIASMLELVDLQYHPFNKDLFNVQPEQLVEQIWHGVRGILDNPDTFDPRIHHIRFSDMMRDPADVIGRVYAASGIPFTDAHADRINARFRDPDHRADRYGKFKYSLEKFGLETSVIRDKFAEYSARFDI